MEKHLSSSLDLQSSSISLLLMRIVNPIAIKGEDEAVCYLQQHKYKIIERNFRKGYGEIDIVAIDLSGTVPVLAFIEVKARTSSQFGTPFEAITYFKLKTLIKTAEFYKATHNNLPEGMRIDGISIILSKSGTIQSVELMKNIS